MKSEMLSWLREYIKSTPKEVISKEWEEIENMKLGGPNAFEYIEFLHQHYCYHEYLGTVTNQIEIPKNMTPNFSGSFFLHKLAL